MPPIYSHRYENGKVSYSDSGISIQPKFSKRWLTIPWSNIGFISPTPALRLIDNQWQTFDGRNLMSEDALETLDFMYFDVVVYNRHELKMGKLSLWESMVFWMGCPHIKPTNDANGNPKQLEGFLNFKLIKRSLNAPLKDLLSFLTVHSKYGLLCDSD